MNPNELEIIFEDNHLLVINKPSGIAVQPDPTGDQSLQDVVKRYIAIKYKKPGDVFCEPTHRIDRPVSGLVMFAKTSKALVRVNEMFQKKLIKKTYWAEVSPKPELEAATLIHFLVRNTVKNTTNAYNKEVANSKKAELSYQLLASGKTRFLLEINPITGRTHQIRSQLLAIKCPIVGDVKYRFPRPNDDKSILLHSKKLEFKHPVGNEEMVFIAPLPTNSFWQIWEGI